MKKNHKKINKQKRSFKIKFGLSNGHKENERLWDGKKDNLQIFTFEKKNVLRQLLFLEIVSSQRLNTNCVDVSVSFSVF